MANKFQSTRPVWGATAVPHLEWDRDEFQSTRPVWGATQRSPPQYQSQTFQSTRPVWGATALRSGFCRRMHNFNPRAPCGARQL